MNRQQRICLYVTLLALTCVMAGYWVTDPQLSEPVAISTETDIEPVEAVGSKHRDPADKLEKLKQRRERQEYNREHPGPLRSFFGSALSFTFAPLLAWLGLLKAAPYLIGGFCLLICGLLLAKIVQTVRSK